MSVGATAPPAPADGRDRRRRSAPPSLLHVPLGLLAGDPGLHGWEERGRGPRVRRRSGRSRRTASPSIGLPTSSTIPAARSATAAQSEHHPSGDVPGDRSGCLRRAGPSSCRAPRSAHGELGREDREADDDHHDARPGERQHRDARTEHDEAERGDEHALRVATDPREDDDRPAEAESIPEGRRSDRGQLVVADLGLGLLAQ